MINNLLCLVFPKRCINCNKKLKQNETYSCENCFGILKYKMCKEDNFWVPNSYYTKLISVFWYEGIIRKLILKFKFQEKAYIGRELSKVIAQKLEKAKEKIDLIIPVPIHINRFMERGYNQSCILAKGIATILKIKYAKNILIKSKDTLKQSRLKYSTRKKNVQGAYKIKNKKKLINKVVLLVDDIYTTGATVNECSKVLIEGGAKEVIVATLARGSFSVRGKKWTN